MTIETFNSPLYTSITFKTMKAVSLFLIIVVAFGLSFSKHLSMIMYPLSAVIFYVYLPVVYASSRINILHHISEKNIWHIRFYPMELTIWFVSTLFFSFILAHLLADLLFPYRESLYHFTYLLITLGVGGITFCELVAKGFQHSSKKTIFKHQGRLLSFQLLFIMFLLFVKNH